MATSDDADRQALRDLVETYATTADRRQAEATAALFTPQGRLARYDGDPSQGHLLGERNGRDELARAFAHLARYAVTTHFLGQQRVELDGDRATGETYCLAHHVTVDDDGGRTMMLMSIRYLDDYVRTEEGWRFAQRLLAVDWTEQRPMAPPGTGYSR
jgi:uncharacterized protein (TIGR02246 family)